MCVTFYNTVSKSTNFFNTAKLFSFHVYQLPPPASRDSLRNPLPPSRLLSPGLLKIKHFNIQNNPKSSLQFKIQQLTFKITPKSSPQFNIQNLTFKITLKIPIPRHIPFPHLKRNVSIQMPQQ